jgi:hypothetical protein
VIGELLLGSTAFQPQRDQNAAGQAEAFEVTASASGDVAAFNVYVDLGSSGPFIVGLYADGGDSPSTLLGSATISSPVAGAWNTVDAPSVSIAAGTTYWIAVLGPSGTIRIRNQAGAGSAQTSLQKDLTELPDTWSTGTIYNDGKLSAYASS